MLHGLRLLLFAIWKLLEVLKFPKCWDHKRHLFQSPFCDLGSGPALKQTDGFHSSPILSAHIMWLLPKASSPPKRAHPITFSGPCLASKNATLKILRSFWSFKQYLMHNTAMGQNLRYLFSRDYHLLKRLFEGHRGYGVLTHSHLSRPIRGAQTAQRR